MQGGSRPSTQPGTVSDELRELMSTGRETGTHESIQFRDEAPAFERQQYIPEEAEPYPETAESPRRGQRDLFPEVRESPVPEQRGSVPDGRSSYPEERAPINEGSRSAASSAPQRQRSGSYPAPTLRSTLPSGISLPAHLTSVSPARDSIMVTHEQRAASALDSESAERGSQLRDAVPEQRRPTSRGFAAPEPRVMAPTPADRNDVPYDEMMSSRLDSDPDRIPQTATTERASPVSNSLFENRLPTPYGVEK